MRDRFGAEDPKSQMIRFHTQTGGVTLTAQQPVNNIVRVALQGFAAVCGGTQSLHTNGYDEALALPTERAAKIALRTQQILAHESGAADTVDPFAGLLLRRGADRRDRAPRLELIEKIDEMGGSVDAIAFIKGEIEESAFGYHERYRTGQDIVVGVNKYEEDDIEVEDILRVDPETERDQLERLKAFKAEPRPGASRKRLEELAPPPRAPTTCCPTSSRRSRTTARSARSAARCASTSASTGRSIGDADGQGGPAAALAPMRVRGAAPRRADARRGAAGAAGALHATTGSTTGHALGHADAGVRRLRRSSRSASCTRCRPRAGRRSTAAAAARATTSSPPTPAARARRRSAATAGSTPTARRPSVPLYRCWIPGNGTHIASNDAGCEGQTTECRLGYPARPSPRCRASTGQRPLVQHGAVASGYFAGGGARLPAARGRRRTARRCTSARSAPTTSSRSTRAARASASWASPATCTPRRPGRGRRRLYRCLVGSEHFASNDPRCEGQGSEGAARLPAPHPGAAQPRLQRLDALGHDRRDRPGYAYERSLGYVLTRARQQPQRRLRLPAGAADHFLSKDPGCEGQRTEGRIGWLYTTPPAAWRPRRSTAA